MRYLKLFEESRYNYYIIDEIWPEVEDKPWLALTAEERVKIESLGFSIEENNKNLYRLTLNYDDDVKLELTKVYDEWYYVGDTYYRGHNKEYKCDGFDGLMACLRNLCQKF